MLVSFDDFMSQLIKTNKTLESFTDFDKVKDNVEAISIKLNQLNYLIGKEDLLGAVKSLWKENSTVFEVLPILIAVRQERKTIVLNKERKVVDIDFFFKTPETVYQYLIETGLAEVLQKKDIKNLVDYVFGVEVGLDTNARKNRGGKLMGDTIISHFKKANIYFKDEVKSSEFSNLDSLGADSKRFDFVIKTEKKTYLIETNFYNSGGSKLNETARAYTELASRINQYPQYEFVWITDGGGWESARNKLEEAFYAIPSLYNLNTLEEFITKVQKEGVVKQW